MKQAGLMDAVCFFNKCLSPYSYGSVLHSLEEKKYSFFSELMS